jgi:hypothetical protein
MNHEQLELDTNNPNSSSIILSLDKNLEPNPFKLNSASLGSWAAPTPTRLAYSSLKYNIYIYIYYGKRKAPLNT